MVNTSENNIDNLTLTDIVEYLHKAYPDAMFINLKMNYSESELSISYSDIVD